MDLLTDNKPDIVLLTETWITSRDTHILSCINNINYCLTLLPRDKRRGGGVGILTKKSIVIIESKHIPLYLSECLRLSVKLSSINFTFFLI